MNGDDPQDDERGALVRIARTLGVPVATFLTADPTDTPDIETVVEGLIISQNSWPCCVCSCG